MRHAIWLVLTLAWVLAQDDAWACATCYGKSDAPMAKGMNMGIASLLAVVVVMWGGLVAFFVHLARRAARVRLKSQAESIKG